MQEPHEADLERLTSLLDSVEQDLQSEIRQPAYSTAPLQRGARDAVKQSLRHTEYAYYEQKGTLAAAQAPPLTPPPPLQQPSSLESASTSKMGRSSATTAIGSNGTGVMTATQIQDVNAEETVDSQIDKIEQREEDLRHVLYLIDKQMSAGQTDDQEHAAERQFVAQEIENFKRELKALHKEHDELRERIREQALSKEALQTSLIAANAAQEDSRAEVELLKEMHAFEDRYNNNNNNGDEQQDGQFTTTRAPRAPGGTTDADQYYQRAYFQGRSGGGDTKNVYMPPPAARAEQWAAVEQMHARNQALERNLDAKREQQDRLAQELQASKAVMQKILREYEDAKRQRDAITVARSVTAQQSREAVQEVQRIDQNRAQLCHEIGELRETLQTTTKKSVRALPVASSQQIDHARVSGGAYSHRAPHSAARSEDISRPGDLEDFEAMRGSYHHRQQQQHVQQQYRDAQPNFDDHYDLLRTQPDDDEEEEEDIERRSTRSTKVPRTAYVSPVHAPRVFASPQNSAALNSNTKSVTGVAPSRSEHQYHHQSQKARGSTSSVHHHQSKGSKTRTKVQRRQNVLELLLTRGRDLASNKKNAHLLSYLLTTLGSAVFYKALDRSGILDRLLFFLRSLIVKGIKLLIRLFLGRRAKLQQF